MVVPQMIDDSEHRHHIVHTLTLLTGIICVVGFGLDMLAISLSPALSSIEWRMGFMQQLGERCIILLFGGALLCYSLQTMPIRLKPIALMCCGLGLCISLSSVFYLQDSFRFRSLAIENLATQRQTLEQQIQQFTPEPASEFTVGPAQKEEAIELLREKTQTLSLRAKTSIQKTVTRTFCSLLLVGAGLIILGQMTLRSKRRLEPVPHYGTVL